MILHDYKDLDIFVKVFGPKQAYQLWFERKWPLKGAAQLGSVALLEEVSHCGCVL